MTRLVRYMKPFLMLFLITVALLFIQAFCELNLPNLMSDIVTVGLQQGGIEHAAPDVISQDGMKLMQTFMSEDEIDLVNNSYELVHPNDKNEDGEIYEVLYEKTKGQDFYVRKFYNDALDKAFGVSAWTFLNVMRETSEESGQGQDTNPGQETAQNSETDMVDIDFSEVYKMQQAFDKLPPEVIASAHENAAGMDHTFLLQSGVAFSKNFYTELGGDADKVQSSYIWEIGIRMLLIALLGGLASCFVSFCSSRTSAGVARNLRRDIFHKVGDFSNAEFDKFSTASLITRTTNDITQVQMLLMMGTYMICYAPIMAIGSISMSVRKSPSLSWILALAVVLLFALILFIFIVAMPKFKIIQKLVDRLNLVSREILSGLLVIRAFGTREHESKRFDEANTDLTKLNLFISRVMTVMMPAVMFIMNGISILIVWIGADRISDSAMQIGDMMAFIQYAMQLIMSFLFISMMFVMIPRASVSAGRIADVLGSEQTIKNPENPKEFAAEKKGYVEFQNVNFRYGEDADEYAVENISFVAKPGETTALIGATGSGKSTIANLILRFYDVTDGAVLVNGVDVREVSEFDLRDRIGFVPQKGALLSGTIASNLRYGNKDATDEELKEYAAVAQADAFINEKPDDYDSEITQGGTNVSGGQKQRLSIARALVKKPDIFIFDDSFSALDFKTDVALRKALKEKTGDSTVILVAQRISTIMNAEQIIVLDDGKIAGKGTHKELLKNCKQYNEIASSQLSKEELA